jgi:hypothetical protein
VQPETLKEEPVVSVNNFRPRKFEDHEIIDGDNKVVGHVRVKPSGILWAPASSKVWYGIPLEAFAHFMELKGKKQKK